MKTFLDIKVNSWAKAAACVTLVVAAPTLFAAPGDLLTTVKVPVGSQSCCGIGIDYDGNTILYTNLSDSTVYKTDFSGADLGNVPLINPDGSPFMGGLNAIAYNFNDGKLYGGAWDGTTNLYKTDLATGVTVLVKANAIPVAHGFIDGLAWDPTDNTLWMSDDVQCNVEHLDLSGNDIGGFDGCAVTGYSNSGLAVSASGRLWYGTNGNGIIFALDTSTNPPTNLGQFASPGDRDEDMVCGPPFTRADGTVVETLLSKDAYNNTFAVIEAAQGDCTPPSQHGRMTGGGSVFQVSRVTHGFGLHCDTKIGANNLEVNWNRNRFHLETLSAATCTDDPKINETPPAAGFDTYKGKGVGRFNGVAGATAEWTFTDAGEPGTGDLAEIVIKDVNGNTVLKVSDRLKRGNHQSHKD